MRFNYFLNLPAAYYLYKYKDSKRFFDWFIGEVLFLSLEHSISGYTFGFNERIAVVHKVFRVEMGTVCSGSLCKDDVVFS